MTSSSDAQLANQYSAIAAEERARWAVLDAAGTQSWADAWELAVDRYGDRPVAQEVGTTRVFSYVDLDRAADRVAAWAVAHGEDRYGVRMANGVAFLAVVLGLAKAGRLAVLLSTQVPAETSADLARGCGVRTVIGAALPGFTHAVPEELLAQAWGGRLPRKARASTTLADPVVIIFTSGTTGRSKPALFSHRRMIGAGIAWGIRTRMAPEDRCYITLPLFHGNGLAVAFSAVAHVGAMAVIRDKFSVTNFIGDVKHHGCTATVYIGELWRYLETIPAKPDDADLPLKIIFGNGLHRALWEPTIQRFGITHVVEHYGATELPAGALTNAFNHAGYCGYVPPTHADAANILLVDEMGRPVPDGTPGELLLRVTGPYRGYLDPAHDSVRLWRDVVTPGDVWWRSGDLLVRGAEGFFTFVDRLGDTYRWRGENVASADVEDALRATGLVEEAVVFGVKVPGEEGKVGMASIVLKGRMPLADLEPIRAHLARVLPAYAMPLFIRQMTDLHGTTATLKIQKGGLAAAPFELIEARPHAVLRDGRYAPLNRAGLEQLLNGTVRIRPGTGVVA